MISDGEGHGSTFFFELPLFAKVDTADSALLHESNTSLKVVPLENRRKLSIAMSVSQIAPSPGEETSGHNSETKRTITLAAGQGSFMLPFGLSFNSGQSSFSSPSWLSHYFSPETARIAQYQPQEAPQEETAPRQEEEFPPLDEETGLNHVCTESRLSSTAHIVKTDMDQPAEGLDNLPSLTRQSSPAAAGRRRFLLDQLQSPDSMVSLHETTSSSRGLRVMVVDDTASTRKIVSKLLVGLGHRVDEASDGLQFLQKMGILQSDDYGEPPAAMKGGYDFILMDDNMPKMCGPDATAAARSAGYTGLIFGLTGNTDSAQLEAYKAKGADMVFTKPLNLNELQEAIKLKLPGRGGL